MNDLIVLSDEDLAFLRMTFELFPVPESPLRFVDDEELEPKEPEATFASLVERGLFHASGTGATDALRRRLEPVSECRARVSVAARADDEGLNEFREFFVADDSVVEYRLHDSGHAFFSPMSERELASKLARSFETAPEGSDRELRLSAGDYLVFAVFARDVRGLEEDHSSEPMSIEEVLSYFAEPEVRFPRAPNQDAWTRSVANLAKLRVLVERSHGFELHPSLHPLARELTADRNSIVHRFDFLDDQWLMREVNLYPTNDTVYRLGTASDGSVVIQELSVSGLEVVLARVISTLPNLLDPEAEPNQSSGTGLIGH